MKISHVLLGLMMVLSVAPESHAHSQSNGLLTLSAQNDSLRGNLRLSLSDLAPVFALDYDGNGELTWGEVKSQEALINAYVLDRLQISVDDRQCLASIGRHQVQALNNGVFLFLPLRTECPVGYPVTIAYRLLFDDDASHRGLLKLAFSDSVHQDIFSPDNAEVTVIPETGSILTSVKSFLWQGLWHIWLGFDHLLFLIALILPLFLYRLDGRWQVIDSQSAIRLEMIKTVTAFTIAHSITLVYATMSQAILPAALVEILIALSVMVAGINIFFPVFQHRHWQVAFLFGLIHGLGFASALQDLALPTTRFVTSLLSFNLGVELGQLAVVLVLFPVFFAVRRHRYYQRLALPAMGVIIVATGSLWAWDRASGWLLV